MIRKIEEYMKKPYWVIDILPKQVPAMGQGQYFKIERYFFKEPQRSMIYRKFSNLLIKLNCYYDLNVVNPLDDGSDSMATEETQNMTEFSSKLNLSENPRSELIEAWLKEGRCIYVVIKSEDAMIGFSGDDHYMTLYHPSEQLLELISSLANSEGLFVWQPTNQE